MSSVCDSAAGAAPPPVMDAMRSSARARIFRFRASAAEMDMSDMTWYWQYGL